MPRRAVVVPLPKGVTRVTNKRTKKEYWYHQDRRGKPDAGPRTTLPEYGTPEFWAAIAKLTGEVKPSGETIRTLVSSYKQQPEWTKRRPNTQATYQAALNHILAAWGDLHPSAISVAGIMALRKSFTDRPAVGNLVLVLVRLLMKFAVQSGLRGDNPAREIDALEVDPDEAKPFTSAAWKAITCDEAPEALRRYAVLARATGQRISDVLRMRPADRDQEGLSLTITKLRDKAHWCPLTQSEIETIDGWKQFPNSTYVTRPNGRRHLDGSFRREWNAFVATEAGAALKGFTPHDLRATKVCDERIRGKSHQQIAAIVGMSLPMVMKYSRHIDQRLAARGTQTERERAKPDNA